MTIRLFDENDKYSDCAIEIDNMAHNALKPIIDLAVKRGYSLRDVMTVLNETVADSVLSAILTRDFV